MTTEGGVTMQSEAKCGARTIFWPDNEAIDAECIRPRDHGGPIHEDENLGEWNERDLFTIHPAEGDLTVPITATYHVRCDTCWGALAPEYDTRDAALAAHKTTEK